MQFWLYTTPTAPIQSLQHSLVVPCHTLHHSLSWSNLHTLQVWNAVDNINTKAQGFKLQLTGLLKGLVNTYTPSPSVVNDDSFRFCMTSSAVIHVSPCIGKIAVALRGVCHQSWIFQSVLCSILLYLLNLSDFKFLMLEDSHNYQWMYILYFAHEKYLILIDLQVRHYIIQWIINSIQDFSTNLSK